MRLTLPLALIGACLVPYASADGGEQTLKVATESLDHIRELTDNLTRSIKAWDGSDLQTALSNIHEPAENTVAYLKNATKLLKDYTHGFSVNQAFRVATPVQKLSYAVNASVATLNSRRKEFKKAQIESIVSTDLGSLLKATTGFTKMIVGYVPDPLQPIADILKGQPVDSLQMGIDCFDGKNSSCSTIAVDRERTYNLAVKYDAMRPDGSPIV